MKKGYISLLKLRKWLILFSVLFMSINVLDRLFPISLSHSQQQFTHIIVSEEGTPLRAFADKKGIWRYPIALSDVSPLYLQALLNYEDHWFLATSGH